MAHATLNVGAWGATRRTDGIYPNNAAILFDHSINLCVSLYIN